LSEQSAGLLPGAAFHVDPALSHKLLNGLRQAAERVASRGQQPVVLCSQSIRRHVRRMSDRILHAVPIMGLNEVDALVRVQSLDTVQVDPEVAQLS